jgi:heptaprenyl diphosphate synthase
LKTYPVPSFIARDLKAVEKRLAKEVAASSALFRKPAAQTVAAGGKRLRPALVLMSAQAGDYDYSKLEPVALAVELLHTATLVHDDVLDGAEQRRGTATVRVAWGDGVAVATGNMLLARTFSVLCGRTRAAVMACLAAAAERLSEGEIMQQEAVRNPDITVDEYTERVRLKTASLFAACCEAGATTAGAPDKDAMALRRYGECLGIAFQIFDDILDIKGDSGCTGKTTGADILDGTITLPLIYAIALDKSGRLRLVMSETADSRMVDEAVGIVASTGAIERARSEARGYVEKAVAAVDGIGSAALKKELTEVGDFVIDRYN